VTVHRCRLTAGADAARPVALVSVADIAKAAQIGKGTVYLYWRTKEELIADVIAGDLLDATDEYHAEIADDPDAVRPERFCWALLRSALDRPLVRAVQVSDVQTIGLLTEHDSTRRLLEHLGPGVLNRDLLRVWRSQPRPPRCGACSPNARTPSDAC
jgi:AcrR family transcriptional regulator